MKETRKPVRKPRTPAAGQPATKPASATSKAAVRKKADAPLQQTTRPPSGNDREELIRVAAYFRAERRGFALGFELDDWLAAEAELGAAAAPLAEPQPTGQRRRATDRKV